MNDTAQHPDDFADAFETAFARLQVRIETACAAEAGWPAQVAAGIRAALAFAAAEPASAARLDQRCARRRQGGLMRIRFAPGPCLERRPGHCLRRT